MKGEAGRDADGRVIVKDLPENVLNLLLLWLAIALSLATAGAHETPDGSKPGSFSLELVFTSHLDASLPERDVFVERQPGSNEVYRITLADINPIAPLFRAARPIPRNPFDAIAIGPHPKGEPLGLTLGEWLGHSGTGTYTCSDGEGRLDTKFTGLVRYGIYSIWHTFTALPATAPFSGYLDVPLGARDGSTSIFVADENGQAVVSQTFRPCLQLSDIRTTSLLAINYHSDGKTHAGRPGHFGYNAHVPLFLQLPPRVGLAGSND